MKGAFYVSSWMDEIDSGHHFSRITRGCHQATDIQVVGYSVRRQIFALVEDSDFVLYHSAEHGK